MYLNTVKLVNFRNYIYGKADFINGVNIIYGNNALGKTNVLEAIHLLSTSKSHRLAKEREIININKTEARISIDFFGQGRTNRGEILLNTNKKKQYIKNRVPVTKTSDLMGFLNVVMFCPEDLKLVKGSPRDRRRMMDMGISQLSSKYYRALINYSRIVEQKNNLLKEHKSSDELWIWNEQLCEYGSIISLSRQNYLKELKEYVSSYGLEISNENIKINYISGVSGRYEEKDTTADYFDSMKKELEKNIHREQKLGQCIIGPHRDDFYITVNEKEARSFASQGQQRTASLCLKLGEVEIIKKHKKEPPVLLLDDVLSELDKSRQEFILSCFSDIQTIITCTHYETFDKKTEANLIRAEDIHVHTFG